MPLQSRFDISCSPKNEIDEPTIGKTAVVFAGNRQAATGDSEGRMMLDDPAPGQEGIEFGPLQEGDAEAISELITRMSDDKGLRLRDKSPAYYRWMYLQNPAGSAVVHSARSGGRIVASFAVAPKRFQVGGALVVLGKTMDMFTDPEFQGRGLIRRCTEAVFEEATGAGMSGWYVTPSPNSYPIFTGRWGYRDALNVVFRARILRFGPVLGAMLRPNAVGRIIGSAVDAARRMLPARPRQLPPGHRLTRLESFGDEVDSLWDEISPGYRVAQVRDSSYLTWRYTQNPDDYTTYALRAGDTLKGIVVLGSTLRRGVPVTEIVDFLCPADDDETLRGLVAAAVNHAEQEGHALVQVWSIEATRLDARLRRAGLTLRRARIPFLLSPEVSDPTLWEPEHWLLTQGDGNDV